jgi:hypothetical protein
MTTISINFPTILSSGIVDILATLALIGLAISGVAQIFDILSLAWELIWDWSEGSRFRGKLGWLYAVTEVTVAFLIVWLIFLLLWRV